MFEIKQLYPLGFSVELAKIFSRSLIGVEFGLGLLLLFPFDLKKWVIPALIAMLGIFVVHLSIEIFTTGNKGNCGCFGALLPMTPLEAIIKNVITITLLIYVFSKGNDNETLPIYFHICGFTTVILFTILNSKWTEKCCCDDNKTTFFNERINLLELNKMEIKLSVLCLKLPTEWVMIMKSSEIEIE
jgi:hypothetical protein